MSKSFLGSVNQSYYLKDKIIRRDSSLVNGKQVFLYYLIIF